METAASGQIFTNVNIREIESCQSCSNFSPIFMGQVPYPNIIIMNI